MKRKMSELDAQIEFFLQFLDTPGDEIAPGSHEIREYFQCKPFRHARLPSFLVVPPFRAIPLFILGLPS